MWPPTKVRCRALFTACAWAGAVMFIAGPASAASIFEDVGGFTVFSVDPSVRSVAMGGASGAVFWGASVNYWANPALLGLAKGITYEGGTSDFTGLEFNTDRWTLGRGGIGFATAGHPFTGLGGLELTVDPITIEPGPVVLSSSTKIRSWGIGASVSGITTSIAGLSQSEPPDFTRYVDLSIGYNRKSSESDFDLAGEPFTVTELGVDWGLLARGSVPFRLGRGETPARVDAAYAYSVQNANDVSSTGAFASSVDRPRRHGVAARFGLDLPPGWRDRVPAWLASGFEPLVSLGGAWDREFISVGSGPIRRDQSHLGGELGLGNVAFLRLGNSGSSGNDRSSWGYGLAIPLGRLGGFQYDETRQERTNGFPDIKSHAWTVWLNAVEVLATLR